MKLKKLIFRQSVVFRSDEDGMISAMGLFAVMFVATVGAIALDMTHLITARTHLQTAADQAAHSAIVRRNIFPQPQTENAAKQDALTLVSTLMPPSKYGNAITSDDITFGTFDPETWAFTAAANATQAVQVNANFTAAGGNAAASYLFNFIGIEGFDIVTSATYVAFEPCANQGLWGDEKVELTSNGYFEEGFCIHSNGYVEMNNNSTFAPDSHVSMPNTGDLVIPASGMESNTGLAEALTPGFRNLNILDDFDLIREGLLNNDENYLPDYITNPIPINLDTRTIRDGDLVPGNVYNVTCNGSRVQFRNQQPIEGVVIVTDCDMRFSQGAIVQDAIMMTTSTSASSISSPSNFQLGKEDDCAPGGGASLFTNGGMAFPSGLQSHEGQFIAQGDISFRANAYGIKGVSMISGQTITATANLAMGLCPADILDDIGNWLNFRLVL